MLLVHLAGAHFPGRACTSACSCEMIKHMRQVSYIAVQAASEVKAQKDVDKEDGNNPNAAPVEVPDTRTSAVPEEVPDTVTNAAPGSCTGIVQGSSGAPMRVPGSGRRAMPGKVNGCSTPSALEPWLYVWCLCMRVCVCVCVCAHMYVSVCVSVHVWVCVCVCLCVAVSVLGAQHCHMTALKGLT